MKDPWRKLLMIASTALGVAGLIFLCLAMFGYEKTWTLPSGSKENTEPVRIKNRMEENL